MRKLTTKQIIAITLLSPIVVPALTGSFLVAMIWDSILAGKTLYEEFGDWLLK